MDKSPGNEGSDSHQATNPERRKLLKLLAAGGAVTAASMLPGKWSSPVVKTGVLPAHAQVTPGRYEIQCDPEWFIGEGNLGPIYNFSATATDTIANQPLAGVVLLATIPGTPSNFTAQAMTDALGVAAFQIEVIFDQVQLPVSATVEFFAPGVYGTDSCTIIFSEPV